MVIDSARRLPDVTGMTSGIKPPAACLIGWPAAHSRSPLIHHYWLRTRGIKRVHLANRTIERASALAGQFGASVLPVAWDALGDILPRTGILVNTTSLGMKGQPPLELDVGQLPSHAVVADLVYVPLDTPLLAAGRARGLKTADGLGMLLHQAVRGFELWFGRRPEVTPELRALVQADLTNA